MSEYLKDLCLAKEQFRCVNHDIQDTKYPYSSFSELKDVIDKTLKKNNFYYEFVYNSGQYPSLQFNLIHLPTNITRSSSYPIVLPIETNKSLDQLVGAASTYGMRNIIRTFFAFDADDNDPDNVDTDGKPVKRANKPKPQYTPDPNKDASEPQIDYIKTLLKKFTMDEIKEIFEELNLPKKPLIQFNQSEASLLIDRCLK